jgi:hypothetical protein
VLWFAVWTVLVVLALLVLGRLAWQVFRKGLAVAEEMGEAADRWSAIAAQIERVGGEAPPQEPAVFADPVRLRSERNRHRHRRRRAHARRAWSP